MPQKQGHLVVVLCWFALCAACSVQDAARPPRDDATVTNPYIVGPRGDPSRLVFEGLQTFTTTAVLLRLMQQPDVVRASHPKAPFAVYLTALRQAVLRGYRHGGFPYAQVTTRVDHAAGTVVLTVVEGPRYPAGTITVSGAQTIPTARLMQRLTHTSLPQHTSTASGGAQAAQHGNRVIPRRPVWQQGKPAPFDAPWRQRLHAEVTAALADLGYFFPTVQVDIRPDTTTKTAIFDVKIVDEGPPGVIDTITLTGNTKDTREDVLRYLDLASGMTIDRARLAQMASRLRNAARFLRYDITPQRVEAQSAQVALHLTLTEYPPAPPLSSDFSAVQHALLRLCDWLSNPSTRQEDLIISVYDLLPDSIVTQAVLSTRSALLILKDEATPDDPRLLYAGVLSPELLAFFSPGQRRLLTMRDPHGQLQISLSRQPRQRPTARKAFQGSFSAGLSFSQIGDEPTAVRLRWRLAPVACAAAATEKDHTTAIDRGVLTLTGRNFRLQADAATGRLRKLTFSPKYFNGTVQAEPGVFARVRQEIETATATHHHVLASGGPLNTWVGYLAEEIVQAPFLFKDVPAVTRQRAARAVRTIFAADILQPLDALRTRLARKQSGDFVIPPHPAPTRERLLLSVLSTLFFLTHNEMHAGEVWLWSVAREAAWLVLSGPTADFEATLARFIASEQYGPLAYLTMAQALVPMDTSAAAAVAREGLRRLSTAAFRRDVRPLLAGDAVFSRVLVNAFAALRDLEETEVEALATLVPSQTATLLRRSAQLLRKQRQHAVSEVIIPALDIYWKRALRKDVRARLRYLASLGYPLQDVEGSGA